jgi:hypothetical protein
MGKGVAICRHPVAAVVGGVVAAGSAGSGQRHGARGGVPAASDRHRPDAGCGACGSSGFDSLARGW